MKISFLTAALYFGSLTISSSITVLNEEFDNSLGFSTIDFFSDGVGDYFGLAGVDDWGVGGNPSGLKAYTGFDGGFLTGMDLNGEGASLPVVVDWLGLGISGLTGLEFSGDFAEFLDNPGADAPGHIDANDLFFVEAQIDGLGYNTILEFVPGSFGSGSFNGVFENGAFTLGNAAQNFTVPIAGSGSTLDLRLTISVNAGNEDFGVDNFEVTGIPEPTGFALLGLTGLALILRRRR